MKEFNIKLDQVICKKCGWIIPNTRCINTNCPTNKPLTKIDQIDLEPLLIKAIVQEEGLGWDLKFAKKVEEEYLRFLILCFQNQDIPIVASNYIDEFWHLHILDTQKYHEDCINHLGYFLHHYPFFRMREKNEELNLYSFWENTLNLYENYFHKKPNEEIWIGSGQCPYYGRRFNDSYKSVFNEKKT